MRFTTPHGSVRYRLPWSWSAFDYRELCRAAARADRRALRDRARSSGRARRRRRCTDRGVLRAPLVVDALGWRRVLGAAGASSRPTRRSRAAWRSTRTHDGDGDELHVLGRARPRPPRLRLARAGGRGGARRRRLLRPAPARHASRPWRSPSARATTPSATRATGSRTACARRPTTACSSSATPPGTASRCRARGSGRRSTSASPAGASCARSLAGAQRRATEALAALRGVLARATPAPFRARSRLQRLVPALPPRVLTRGAARARAPAARRPRLRLVPGPGAPVVRRGARARDGARRLTDPHVEIAFDERGLVPVVVQDWRTGEVLTLAYANAEASRARARPASCTSGAARATSCGTRARRPATRRRSARCASTATATRCSRSSSPPARPATPASARASTTATLEPPAPHEALPALERTLRRPRRRAARRAPTRSSCSTTRRAIGEKVKEEAEEVARAAREETDDRVDEEAADVLYHLAVLLRSRGRDARATPRRCSMAVAAERPPLRGRAVARRGPRARRATTTSCPLRHTFIDDTETPVSAFLKLRGADPGSPAFLLESAEQGQRVGRYSFIGVRPREVVRWSLGDAGDPYAIAAREVGRATARRRCPTCRRSPAARSASSATTSCARSSRSASRTRTRSGCPTWR